MLFAFINCRVQKFCTPWHLITSLRTLSCSHKNICCLPGLDFYHPAFWVCSLCSLSNLHALWTRLWQWQHHKWLWWTIWLRDSYTNFLKRHYGKFGLMLDDYSIFWSNCFIETINFDLWVSSMSHTHTLSRLCVAFNPILIGFDFYADFFCSDIFFDC